MAKNRDDKLHLECGERLLDLLEDALRRTGRLPPITAEQARVEQSQIEPGTSELVRKPDWYDDPHAALLRGRYLLEHSPTLALTKGSARSAAQSLALAARNGRRISPEIRRIMDADRERSEQA